jgi:hypothetical protein
VGADAVLLQGGLGGPHRGRPAVLTWGEGWHNNHHAHPTAARHGLAWYEVDMNWWGIRTLKLLGLAKDIKLVNVAGQSQAAVSGRARLKAAA